MSKQLCPEPTRTQGGAAPACTAGPVCEDYCFRRKCSPGTVETGSYLYDISATCVKTNERWVDAAGAAFDPDEVYRVACAVTAPAEPAAPVEIACQPVTAQYADCDGVLQTATGTTCDLIQVVPHPDAVMKVKICETADRELVKRCDPTTGDEILIQYDVTTVPPTVLGATNLSTGTAYTGSLTVLGSCGGGAIEVEQELFCDNGTTFIRWFVIDEFGKPSGVYWDTDLQGQPYIISTQTPTYFKNGVELTDGTAITAAQTAIASATSTVVNCLPPEENATCYQVAEPFTQTYQTVETLEMNSAAPAFTPGQPIWMDRLEFISPATNQAIAGKTLRFSPHIQVYDGTTRISAAAFKAALQAAGYLEAWQSVDPRIDRFDVVQVGGALRVYALDDDNLYSGATRTAIHEAWYYATSGSFGVNGIYGLRTGAYSNIVSTRTVTNQYKVIASDGVTVGECKTQECLQSISDATGDDLSTLFPGTSFSITKPECCVVKVTTDIGSFTLRNGVTSYTTSAYKCNFSVTAVEIVSGNCTLDKVHIISNSSVEV